MMKFHTAAVESAKEFGKKSIATMKQFGSKCVDTYHNIATKENAKKFAISARNFICRTIKKGYNIAMPYAVKTLHETFSGIIPIIKWISKIALIALIASFFVPMMKSFSGLLLTAWIGVGIAQIILSILVDTFSKMLKSDENNAELVTEEPVVETVNK